MYLGQEIRASGNDNDRQSGGQSARLIVYFLFCDNCDHGTLTSPACQCSLLPATTPTTAPQHLVSLSVS